MSRKLIEIKNAFTGYNDQLVLKNISVDIFDHDFIGVIGPNGGGKTTFIKLILNQLPLLSGTMEIHDTKIGYLPQTNSIDKKFPITSYDVVLSGLMSSKKLYKRYTKLDKNKAEQILDDVGIAHLKNKTIGELSGGEMQRAFLGRALISEPDLLILDEPDTYVDSNYEGELYQKLKELNEHIAIILVSHDLGIISSHVKSIACVNKEFHYHKSNKITNDQLASYNCPIQLITHGNVPHTVLDIHNHK